MIKIKVSYNTDYELQDVVRLLTPALVECRMSKNKDGRFKKAYILIDPDKCAKQVNND